MFSAAVVDLCLPGAVVADVDQGLSLGWGLGGQAAQALTSINGIVVTHIQRDDLLVLNHQMKTKA